MSQEEKCYLCEKSASASLIAGDKYDVNCEICGRYIFLNRTNEVEYNKMPREERAMLSAYTRERFELGEEPPELGDPKNLEEIIAEYKNKTAGEKLKNLIWYIRKKSPQFGDSISLDAEKDYPITYSLSLEGFTEIIKNPIGQKLIEPTESGLKLTEEGWTLGAELMESKEGSEP
ncbi:MAG: hypothetical protein GTN73_11230 [Candidatus Aminicenantes bacterium]|nr:hypothetical protein [Candidatus Aminicenantes bacterium]